MADYLTVNGLISLKGSLTTAQIELAQALIPVVCSELRARADMTGRDLDEMVYASMLSHKWDVFHASGSQTAFELSRYPQKVTAVQVYGADLDESEWTLSGQTLTLAEAPETGAEVIVSYTYRSLLDVAASVVADVVMRELAAVSSDNPMLVQATQYTESALGYSQSFTLPNTGGGLFIKRSELARLGLRRQRYGALDLYGLEDRS